MTQHDIEKGLLTMLVGFAPVKPAEIVILQIQAKVAVPV
jgi:phage tail sheath protein FI